MFIFHNKDLQDYNLVIVGVANFICVDCRCYQYCSNGVILNSIYSNRLWNPIKNWGENSHVF